MPSPLPPRSDMQRSAAALGASMEGMPLRDALRAAGEFGLLRSFLPASLGGLELAGDELADAWEGVGQECSRGGLLFALGAHALAVVAPVAHAASEEVRAELLPKLMRGELLGAHAASEAGAGSDTMAMEARATRDASGFRISGSKLWVTNGADADVFVVFAALEEEGAREVTAFLVPRTAQGLSVGAPMDKIGLEDASLTSLYLDEVLVEAPFVLGGVGGGGKVFGSAMRYERTLILAPQVGAMRTQLERSVAHARSRKQFGRSIGKNQLVAGRIVDMYQRYITARACLREACTELMAGTLDPARACLTKLHLSEAALAQHLDAMRTLGGTGLLAESGVPAQIQHALGGLLYSGTSDMQRVIIAAHLGLG